MEEEGKVSKCFKQGLGLCQQIRTFMLIQSKFLQVLGLARVIIIYCAVGPIMDQLLALLRVLQHGIKTFQATFTRRPSIILNYAGLHNYVDQVLVQPLQTANCCLLCSILQQTRPTVITITIIPCYFSHFSTLLYCFEFFLLLLVSYKMVHY